MCERYAAGCEARTSKPVHIMKFQSPAIEILSRIVCKKRHSEITKLPPDDVQWRGYSPREWAQTVTGELYQKLPNESHTRRQLHRFIQGGDLSEREIYLAVMAWGRQKPHNGRLGWAGIDRIVPILRELRQEKICRLEGYSQFHNVTTSSDHTVKGIGPAFYTKLLFFVPPHSPGYILDQWTAKSMQLLIEREGSAPFIKLTKGGYVAKSNDVDVYENFCHFIEAIAARYGLDEGDAEELIFSRSGQDWRSHVRTHWTTHA